MMRLELAGTKDIIRKLGTIETFLLLQKTLVKMSTIKSPMSNLNINEICDIIFGNGCTSRRPQIYIYIYIYSWSGLNSQSNSFMCWLISISLFGLGPLRHIAIRVVIEKAIVLLDEANTVLKGE